MTRSRPTPHILRLKTEADTRRLSQAFAQHMQPEDVLLLSGGLAAGKTFFVKAAVAALGSADLATSPTYTLANIYQCPQGPIVHIDAYRLEDTAAFQALGLEDELETGMAFIEWGGPLVDQFESWVALEFMPVPTSETARDVKISASGKRGAALLAAALATYAQAPS